MRSIYTAALALTASLCIAASTLAAPPAKAAASSETLLLAQSLHQTALLLNAANHDYDGFRGKAVSLIHHAIHTLEPRWAQIHVKPLTTAAPAPKEPAVREDQAKSDAILKQALQQLVAIHTQLAGMPGKHHQKAAVEVAEAIQHLNVALKIK